MPARLERKIIQFSAVLRTLFPPLNRNRKLYCRPSFFLLMVTPRKKESTDNNPPNEWA
jgi:hypothetical protein